MGQKIRDLTAQRFGRLVVVKRAENDTHGGVRWLCKCDCGKDLVTRRGNLVLGYTKSCGCLALEIRTLPEGEASFNRALSYYKYNALKRDIEWSLTEGQFKTLTQQNCHYCGSKPSTIQKSRHNNGDYTYNGIDRIDSDRGYDIDNVVPCCEKYNFSKRDQPYEEFIKWLDKITLFKRKEVV